MKTRKHELILPIDTTPENLWSELTEAERLTRWFAPQARVTPGVGGSIWVSWGEGMEGEQKIDVWEPGKRLTLSLGPQTVEYIIESGEGGTVLRLVHSGFSAEAQFDDEFESTLGGWTTFLRALRHDLEGHFDQPAVSVSILRQVPVNRAEAFARLSAAPELAGAVAEAGHVANYGGYTFAGLADSYLAVFCEGKNNAMVTTSWTLYGFTPEQAEEFKARWTSRLDELFPA